MSNKCPYFIAHCTDTDLPYFAYFPIISYTEESAFGIHFDPNRCSHARLHLARTQRKRCVDAKKNIYRWYLEGKDKTTTSATHTQHRNYLSVWGRFLFLFCLFCFVFPLSRCSVWRFWMRSKWTERGLFRSPFWHSVNLLINLSRWVIEIKQCTAAVYFWIFLCRWCETTAKGRQITSNLLLI